MSFFRARSPVTPKITSPQGPAIRGRRLSRGSRSGLTRPTPSGRHRRSRWRSRASESLTRALQDCPSGRLWSSWLCTVLAELGPGLLELVDALVLEHQEHVAQVDPDPLQPVEHLLRLGGGAGDPVAVDLAVVGERHHGLLRHRVDRVRRDQLGDVEGVRVLRVLHAGRRPQRPLRPRRPSPRGPATGRRRRPPGRRRRPAARSRRPPYRAAPAPRRCRSSRAACRSRCRPGRRRTRRRTRSSPASCPFASACSRPSRKAPMTAR